MNYLAHLYLSGDDENTLLGNFIGDCVKGKNYTKYPEPVQKGILLHRRIDFFTDTNSNFRKAKQLLRPDYGLHAGIVTDLFYDHFLAKNWNCYAPGSLRNFAKKVHSILLSRFLILPKRVQGFLPFLVQNKRLESYATAEGIQESLEIMSRHTSLPGHSAKAVEIMIANLDFFEDNFSCFMHEILEFVEQNYGIEIKKPGWIAGP